MAAARETRTKQRAVIEFLFAEHEKITNIHRRLQHVYGDEAVDRSTVSRWVSRVSMTERGKAILSDLPRSGRPHTAVTPETVQRADRLLTSICLAP